MASYEVEMPFDLRRIDFIVVVVVGRVDEQSELNFFGLTDLRQFGWEGILST